MADLKTQKNTSSAAAFIEAVEDESKQADCRILMEIMAAETGEEPAMWGSSIVGFGSYHFKYASGREGDWFLAGFAPRKQALTIYIMDGFSRRDELMGQLGKHSTGKSCLYIKKLDDVDLGVLRELIEESVRHMQEKYPQ